MKKMRGMKAEETEVENQRKNKEEDANEHE